MFFSVVVPVYNVEQYLKECVDSILSQTFKDFELILVNDGSKDSSPAICDEYAKKDDRIKVIHKPNGGLSDARNVGTAAAKGEYVIYIDSDDYVTTDMYQKMYQKAISGNFDMVVCDLNYIYDDKIVPAYSNLKTDTTNIKKTILSIF